MAKTKTYLHALNIGVQDEAALPRVDLERMRLAAEVQTNIICKATGPGFMRPGFEYLSTTQGNAVVKLKEFIFGVADAALMEFTDQSLRIRVNDVLVTRPAVTATVTNGDFSSGAGWTLTATAGASCTITGGLLQIGAAGRGSSASAQQAVAVNEPNVEHALRIVVARGPITFRCGANPGTDEYIAETDLATGVHSLAFTPTGSAFNLSFVTNRPQLRLVDSIQVEAAGIMTIPAPWTSGDLSKIRTAQSADVVFVAADGYQQRRIERRSTRSWSVVLYQSDDGPFKVGRTRPVKLKVNNTEGNGDLTADGAFFTPQHVGAIFRLDSEGQAMTTVVAGAGQFSEPFRVSGIQVVDKYDDRSWLYTISGTWSGVLRCYRSFNDKDSGYTAFRKSNTDTATNISANVAGVVNGDEDNNSIIWYRIGFAEGEYTSGAATIATQYNGGGGYGICRVTAYVNPTLVRMEVLTPFKNSNYTSDWREGEWSDAQIWPSSVAFSDGRLWWSGADRFWGSVSDAFDSFDEETEGDSGPISRSIATGGVNDTQWMLSLQRMIIGTEGSVSTAKASTLDEPLTPTNTSIKDSSTTGSAQIEAVKVDSRGIFVERAGTALMEVVFDSGNGDYVSTQLSKLTTDIFSSGIRSVAVQRRPDTRIWIVNNDGSCVCCVYEAEQQVLAFIPIETDGLFESVAVLPAVTQDRVYCSIARTINGSTVRYIEKMALDSDVDPGTLCKVMDAFKSGTNSPASTTIAVGTHLIGESVVVWADGAPLETAYGIPATFVVNGSGNITVPSAVTNWVAGLPYRARYKSSRLAYGGDAGTAMLRKKAVDAVGMIMTNFVRQGIKIGASFDDPYRGLDHLPMMTDNAMQPDIVSDIVRDEESVPFAGEWNTDSRVCMEINSPYTGEILGIVLEMTTN